MDGADTTAGKKSDAAGKQPFILATKLYVPRTHALLVDRPHLSQRLDSCLNCRLTLVSAPAGFGKTTLVAGWIRARQEFRDAERASRGGAAWVSLDQHDNDPARFLTYAITGLQKIAPEIGQSVKARLELSAELPVPSLLAELINEIAQHPQEFAVIFDDFHLITAHAVHEACTFLLENQPPNLHLIVISRADPPWPLARLRAQRELNEIRAKDLRFSAAETGQFLNEIMQLGLTANELAALDSRTEGWIAGLQMAALSMRGGTDTAAFIKAFTGSHRYVLDYLIEEVLERQPSDIQEFLLYTSILEQMHASLCDAVLERRDSQSVLAGLEQSNLFLIPLDDDRRWYRYHHLFADLLQSRLGVLFPDKISTLHQRASGWHEENGLINEAVRHAISAGDFHLVARLIGSNALAMAYHGELKSLIKWMEALPAELVRSQPALCIANAWALGFSGKLNEVEPWLARAERALSAIAPGNDDLDGAADIQHVSSQIAAARAYAAGFADDITLVAKLARQALAQLPPEDLMTRALTTSMMGIGLRMTGDYEACAKAFDEAISLCRASGDSHLLMDILWERSLLEFGRGKLNQVMATCQEAIHLADEYASRTGRRLPVVGYIYERMGVVLLERNQLEDAFRCASEGVNLCKKWGNADALVNSSYGLVKVHLARGEVESAQELIQAVSHLIPGLGGWYVTMASAVDAQIQLMQGDRAAAVRWVERVELSPDDEFIPNNTYAALTAARLLMAETRHQEAIAILDQLVQQALSSGGAGLAIHALARKAAAHQLAGESTAALDALEEALALAEPEGYVRTFLVEGEPMRILLRKAADSGGCPTYASRLLAAFADQPAAVSGAPPAAQTLLGDPLSQRELDVLRLLNTHLSSTEIADELCVAPSTVRSHIKNIYSKLDVHRRAEAVVRAEQLNLFHTGDSVPRPTPPAGEGPSSAAL